MLNYVFRSPMYIEFQTFMKNRTLSPLILPKNCQSERYVSHTFNSGIQAHGGILQAKKTARHVRWVKPYAAFILLLRGEIVFGIGDCQYCFSQPTALLVNVKQPTLFSRAVKANELIEKYTFTGLQFWLKEIPYTTSVQSWPLDETILTLLKKVDLHNSENPWHDEMRLMHLLSTLWQQCQSYCPANATQAATSTSHADLGNRLEAAFDRGAQSAEALATYLGMSSRTLNRHLHQFYGISTAQWLTHRRMYLAGRALSEGKTIGETAYLCGYRHNSAFVQRFRQYFGCTPGEYLAEFP